MLCPIEDPAAAAAAAEAGPAGATQQDCCHEGSSGADRLQTLGAFVSCDLLGEDSDDGDDDEGSSSSCCGADA